MQGRWSREITVVGVVTLTFAAVGVAHAAPSVSGVSGTVSDGNTVTVSGSGFGTKATAAPLVFDTFESGVNGTDIVGEAPDVTTLGSGSWTWDGVAVGGVAYPQYTSSNQRTGSTLSALADMNGTQWNESLSITTQQSEYFASWYVYYDHYAGSISRNTKPWFMYGSSNDEPHTYAGWGDLSDSGFRSSIADATWSDSNTSYGNLDTPDFYGQWMKVEVYLKQSTPNVADGVYKVWVTEPGQATVLQLNRDPVQTRNTSNVWQQFTFVGAYCDSDPADRRYRIYADDFYFDKTRARVELGNAATYAASTVREVQPATVWSASSATVTVNQGSFANGATAYLYVVDSAGAVNANGYAVTIGSGTPDTTPPAGPMNLAVQ